MKSFLGVLFTLVLISAGCESTSTSASNEEKAPQSKEKESTSQDYMTETGTDYSTLDEIKDISGNIVINGTITNAARATETHVKLWETEGKDIFLLDSAKVDNGSFTMNLKEVKTGVYKLGFKSFKCGEFIINPNEKEISLTANAASMERTIKVTNSKENKAFSEYKTIKSKHDVALKSIKQLKASRDVKLKKIYDQEAKLALEQEKIANEYEGTYFSKMVRRWQSPHRFEKEKYWDDVDFTDESLVRSMVLNDRIQDYMRIHASKDGEFGFENAVDRIKTLSSVNDEVLNFMLYTMMEGFYTSGMEDKAFYVVDNYIHGDGCGDNEISSLVDNRAQGLKSLKIGERPPNFTIADPSGKVYDMRKVAAKNDLTLIMFWASWCHKCEQEMPVIKRIYDANKAKGFEIIGVSVDGTKREWEQGIKAKGCDWINVSQLEQWQSPVAKDYRISSTPVMFLVDSKGEIVLKPDRAFKLENWMKQNF